jgi:uroporphyrinogen-III synthase
MKSLFISKDLSHEKEFLFLLKERNVLCEFESLIRFEILNNIESVTTEWIFFSSPSAVKLYNAKFPSCRKKWAAIGIGTASSLPSRFEFIGTGNQIEQIVNSFEELPNSNSVTCISPEDGNRSVLNSLRSPFAKELILYRTLPNPIELRKHNGYIFTSPSNVKAAAMKNNIQEFNTACFGQLTHKELLHHNPKSIQEFQSWVWVDLIDEIEIWLSNL